MWSPTRSEKLNSSHANISIPRGTPMSTHTREWNRPLKTQFAARSQTHVWAVRSKITNSYFMAALSLRSSAIGVRKFGAASSRHSHGMCHKKDINGCEFGENDDIKDLVVSSSLHSHGKCHNKGCNISIIALYCCKRSFKLLAKWSRRAAEEAEHVATISFSGHGRAYVDGFVTLHPFFSLQFFRQ